MHLRHDMDSRHDMDLHHDQNKSQASTRTPVTYCTNHRARNWGKNLVVFPIWRWCLSKVLSQLCDRQSQELLCWSHLRPYWSQFEPWIRLTNNLMLAISFSSQLTWFAVDPISAWALHLSCQLKRSATQLDGELQQPPSQLTCHPDLRGWRQSCCHAHNEDVHAGYDASGWAVGGYFVNLIVLALSLPSSKSTFSQTSEEKLCKRCCENWGYNNLLSE